MSNESNEPEAEAPTAKVTEKPPEEKSDEQGPSKWPDLKELGGFAAKLAVNVGKSLGSSVQHSVKEIVTEYKAKREQPEDKKD